MLGFVSTLKQSLVSRLHDWPTSFPGCSLSVSSCCLLIGAPGLQTLLDPALVQVLGIKFRSSHSQGKCLYPRTHLPIPIYNILQQQKNLDIYTQGYFFFYHIYYRNFGLCTFLFKNNMAQFCPLVFICYYCVYMDDYV